MRAWSLLSLLALGGLGLACASDPQRPPPSVYFEPSDRTSAMIGQLGVVVDFPTPDSVEALASSLRLRDAASETELPFDPLPVEHYDSRSATFIRVTPLGLLPSGWVILTATLPEGVEFEYPMSGIAIPVEGDRVFGTRFTTSSDPRVQYVRVCDTNTSVVRVDISFSELVGAAGVGASGVIVVEQAGATIACDYAVPGAETVTESSFYCPALRSDLDTIVHVAPGIRSAQGFDLRTDSGAPPFDVVLGGSQAVTAGGCRYLKP